MRAVEVLRDIAYNEAAKEDDDEDDVFHGFQGNQLAELPTAELDSWLSQATITSKAKDSTVRIFWQSKQYDFRILSLIARDHMGVSASSAPSERVFSAGGDIVTKRRNCLSRDNLRFLLCLRSWGIIPEAYDWGEDREIEEAQED